MAECSRKKCTSVATATPLLLLRFCPGGNAAQARLLELGVCDLHQQETTVGDLLGDDAFEAMVASFQANGMRPPARELTELLWERVSSDPFEAMITEKLLAYAGRPRDSQTLAAIRRDLIETADAAGWPNDMARAAFGRTVDVILEKLSSEFEPGGAA